MSQQPPSSEIVVELVQEAHLRLAVLLDQIDDEMAAGLPVTLRLAQLCLEYDRHTQGQERMLDQYLPHLLEQHRNGHDLMRDLLARMRTDYALGHDIRPVRNQVLALFADRLMPDDTVFKSLPSALPASAPL